MVETVSEPSTGFAQDVVELLASYEWRCRENAMGLPQQDVAKDYWEGVMFYVGNERLISPLGEINEILNYPASMTRVPGTKPWMLGVANIRGTLLPIIDLQMFLIGKKTERGRRSRVLVFALGTGQTGILVGDMVGMRHFSKDTATGKRDISGYLDNYVEYGFDQDGITWPVFKLSALADDPTFQIAAI